MARRRPGKQRPTTPPGAITDATHQTAGTAVYAPWFAGYLVPFLIRNNAIAILPNYRLAPEHTGDDILSDIASLGTWLTTSLPAYLASKNPSISPDLSRVLVSGESAGGWVALQSVLSLPQNTFRACLLQYPVVNAFPTSPDDIIMGESIPPKEVLDEFLASIVPGTIISAARPPARDAVAPMLRAHGRWGEFFGTERHLMPDTRIEDAGFFVPTYILHGRDDTNVGVEWTEGFVARARELFPKTRFELVTPEGDHGFDGDVYEEEAGWLGELLRGVEGEWLA
ncbi:alpha/beta-hydrolase [Karstenula rhodostoma CBS 690.94]|uniref:Alpha/beta-hydrolase n=1 Tax=Karstenula rhodostoma CBS 690.94 TaxID=1392251 RepID=A0A9P4P4Y7_9PLEO|nr:alpha/beta-hydrolase [Karstenula rhodostoma CBS 690.94]